ncbi:uncharacterized protein [Apostichopus japonicus]|uniref:uncharacterized protein isoform X1 n=1 Tax=Stichopus japonicus TaxID=307972 RepID=UPI003AB77E1D
MSAESMIGKDGGKLDIQNTGVSLEIPPGALRRDYFIRMRIIPHYYLDETELSFASNSSVVVELLPNNIKILIPATLTLPHCLVLKKKCAWKAKVYSSHHKEGTRPKWEEERNTQCDVTYKTCVMRLYNFCWKKFEIGDHIVEAKKIMLFAAKSSSTENEIFLHIGYYWQLPSCKQILELNSFIVLRQVPAVFFKEGQLPLTVLFEKAPRNWKNEEATKTKEISFSTVAITEGSFRTFLLNKTEESFRTFLLNKMASDETDRCACYFKAGQGSDLVELIFPLTVGCYVLESSLSRTEATTPSMGIATAGDTQSSTTAQTEDSDVSEKSLQDLSEKVGKCWMDVGRKLQLTEEQLENLEQKSYTTLEEKIYQMLLVWKRKRASAATYVVLADALGNARRVDLQEYLLKKYKPT